MAHLTVDRARAGMVLAAPVTDRRGRLLIPAGAELTERHLEALPMWGVDHVDIEGDRSEDHAEPEIDPAALAEAEGVVRERFGGRPASDAFLDALFSIAVDREARALAAGRRLR